MLGYHGGGIIHRVANQDAPLLAIRRIANIVTGSQNADHFQVFRILQGFSRQRRFIGDHDFSIPNPLPDFLFRGGIAVSGHFAQFVKARDIHILAHAVSFQQHNVHYTLSSVSGISSFCFRYWLGVQPRFFLNTI